jgi:uncharacterized membrane protein HdeD (DUF308 family)
MEYLVTALLLVGALTIGAALYGLRCHWRLLYGSLEIVTGLVVIFFIRHPQRYGYLLLDGPDPSALGVFLSSTVTILAGVYIIVRGFDNIDQSLPVRWRAGWDRLFARH